MFTLPELPYAYNALEPFIDERTMQIHHDKHHAAYVKNLNDALAGQDALLKEPAEALLCDLSRVPESIRMKVRNNGGGHVNHTMFWDIMGPPATRQKTPAGALATAINTAFGNFEQFQEKFSSAGLGRFGSGWVWLNVEKGSLTISDTPNQDNPLMEDKHSILCLDVWEHAYYLKYQNVRAEYITQWWNVVDWSHVEKRFASL